MSKLTPLEIYKVLPKTNCRQCQMSTCMAFASAVIQGQKRLSDCPFIDEDVISRFEGGTTRQTPAEKKQIEVMESLREQISATDLRLRAEVLGAEMRGERLVVKCLGKEFEIDEDGHISSQCHTHVWFSIPLFNYVLSCKGLEPTGEWLPFRLLKGGASRGPLFEKRCEIPLRNIADTHIEFFEYMVDIFNGAKSDYIDSDISVVLYPFPRVPLLVSYWRPEGDMESQLHLFFDSSVEGNLDIDTVFYLGVGIANMMEKIIIKHQ